MNPVAPTLGNLLPFVQSLASQQQPAFTFLDSQFTDLKIWREQARRQLLNLLRYSPPEVPLNPQVVETVDCGDFIREKVYFSSDAATRIPALLLRPREQHAPAPAIVALHDHGGFYLFGKEKLVEMGNEPADLLSFRQTYYSSRAYASDLARRGYVVLVTDAFYFGERRLDMAAIEPDMRQRLQNMTGTQVERVSAYHEQCSVFEEVVARHLFAAGVTWLGILSHDDRTSVSYLVSRPEVDPQRVGCLGLSMGGHRTDYLVATDPRIKAAVSVGWMTNWNDLLANQVRMHSWAQIVPGLASSFELSDVVSIGMPAALLILECGRDELFNPTGMQRACEKIEAIYAKAGLGDRYQFRFYDVPHQFNAVMQQYAFTWLDQWLK